ncbi:MAG: hypothetical protein JNK78_01975 [Planctomycetes bacterium]|nr:hypothetical protein [Planctomycetota bacterium]
MRPLSCLLSLLAWLPFHTVARGQCQLDWESANARPDLGGNGLCSTSWDPDGAGPAIARLVVGGNALVGGTSTQAGKVATFDGTRWTTLGTGPGTAGEVRALTVWNGQLIAGGTFTGGGTDRIAAWNGTSWQPLGAGAPTVVTALTVWNSLLVAVGYFTTPALASVRTWDGSSWTTLPNPPNLQFALATISYQGSLCVGGYRVTGSQGLGVFERWNGSTWATSVTATDSANQFGKITCFSVRGSLAVGGTDTLYAGGTFTSIGGVTAVALASTTGGTSFNWSAVGSNLASGCVAVHARPVGLTGYTVTAAFTGGGNLVRQ